MFLQKSSFSVERNLIRLGGLAESSDQTSLTCLSKVGLVHLFQSDLYHTYRNSNLIPFLHAVTCIFSGLGFILSTVKGQSEVSENMCF